MDAVISFRGVTKRFRAVLANDAISFDVQRGTVHALLGENGAGKTTLLSILTGFQRPDAGTVRIDGRPFAPESPAAALAEGIGLCAQHFLLAGALTGAENVLLGRPGCRGLRPLPPERIEAVRRLAEANRLEVPLDIPAERLSIAEQERLEILKLLERECRILVLDEPTSVLAPPEVGPLFATLRRLAAGGRTILLVTHRLAEVAQVADRVTVLRRGRVAGEGDPRALDTGTLVHWIAGEEPARPPVRDRARARGEAVLEARGLSAGAGPCAPHGIDLEVHAGEIVGIGGVLGNGQAEVVGAITGRLPLRAGSVRMLGRTWTAGQSVRLPDAVALVPEDRRGEGLALEMTAAENLRIGLPADRAPRGEEARRRLQAFDVRPADPSARAAQLSGGNQQRLLLARELARDARLLVAVHPTRGLDPGAAADVRRRLLEARAGGLAVLLVTGDLDELRALSDRILVLFRGRALYSAAGEEVDPETLNRALVGIPPGGGP